MARKGLLGVTCANPRPAVPGTDCCDERVTKTLDFRAYQGGGYAHLERLPDGTLSVNWRPKGEQGGSRFSVCEDDAWQDFERQAQLEGHPWSPDQEMLADLQRNE